MGALLAQSRLGWETANGPLAAELKQLLLAVVFGVAGYTGVLIGLWVLSGKPDGPEADLLKLMKTTVGHFRGLRGRGAAVLR
jgi:hypothetical protein